MLKSLNKKSAAIKSFAFAVVVIVVSAVVIISPWQHQLTYAFPFNATPLDNFNRTNAATLGANWTIVNGDNNLQIISNTAAGTNAAGNMDYWNVAQFGPDSEAYVTISTLAGSGNDIIVSTRLTNPGTTPSEYRAIYTQGTGLLLYERVSGSFLQLGSTLTPLTLAAGDKIGISSVGSTITAWYKQGAGAWTNGIQVTNTDVTGSGFIAMEMDSTVGRLDDFGGGTINASPAAPTLIAPSSGATGVAVTPTFQFRTTDADNDYLKYKIIVYNSDCSTGAQTFDQTSSQTGWSGQDQQTGTAYTGSSTLSSSTIANFSGVTLSYNTQYCWKAAAIDPGGTNIFGSFSSTRLFTTAANVAPAAPTLITPPASATGISVLPIFQLRTTDAESDYLKYFIQIYTATACGGSQVGSNIDQTASQTGWQGQNQQSSTAYTGSSSIAGSTIALYQYSGAALTLNHLYSWRAKAIDPGGSQTFGSLSSCQDFTTGSSEVQIRGGTSINGGTIIK